MTSNKPIVGNIGGQLIDLDSLFAYDHEHLVKGCCGEIVTCYSATQTGSIHGVYIPASTNAEPDAFDALLAEHRATAEFVKQTVEERLEAAYGWTDPDGLDLRQVPFDDTTENYSFPWLDPFTVRQHPWGSSPIHRGDWLLFAADRVTLYGEPAFPLFGWALALENQFRHMPRPGSNI